MKFWVKRSSEKSEDLFFFFRDHLKFWGKFTEIWEIRALKKVKTLEVFFFFFFRDHLKFWGKFTEIWEIRALKFVKTIFS